MRNKVSSKRLYFSPDKEINAEFNEIFFFSKDLSGRMTISEIRATMKYVEMDIPDRFTMYLKYNYCKETAYKGEQAFRGISIRLK